MSVPLEKPTDPTFLGFIPSGGAIYPQDSMFCSFPSNRSRTSSSSKLSAPFLTIETSTNRNIILCYPTLSLFALQVPISSSSYTSPPTTMHRSNFLAAIFFLASPSITTPVLEARAGSQIGPHGIVIGGPDRKSQKPTRRHWLDR